MPTSSRARGIPSVRRPRPSNGHPSPNAQSVAPVRNDPLPRGGNHRGAVSKPLAPPTRTDLLHRALVLHRPVVAPNARWRTAFAVGDSVGTRPGRFRPRHTAIYHWQLATVLGPHAFSHLLRAHHDVHTIPSPCISPCSRDRMVQVCALCMTNGHSGSDSPAER